MHIAIDDTFNQLVHQFRRLLRFAGAKDDLKLLIAFHHTHDAGDLLNHRLIRYAIVGQRQAKSGHAVATFADITTATHRSQQLRDHCLGYLCHNGLLETSMVTCRSAQRG
ncbi:hypothetical protein BOO30_06635 [Vibrio navarrensis]|nr:hypothetical protein [Vibrio navarrensis]MBE4596083.1 hypothetical protein [Vibrio navarrensis]